MAVEDNISLYDFCNTDRQREFVAALYDANFNQREAARRVGVNESVLRTAIKNIKKRGAKAGYAPETYQKSAVPSPEGFFHSFSTVHVDADGNVKQSWVRFKRDLEDYAQEIQAAIREFYESSPPPPRPAKPALSLAKLNKDIIPWIQIGDAHLGMLAHANEVGRNFDIKIAEVELKTAIDELIDQLPDCERCVINDLGDFTHYENYVGKTEASGHDLDCDTRFPKMLRAYSRLMRYIVESALSKFQYVDIIINQGS